MTSSTPDLKVFVSNEVLDFRTLEDRPPKTSLSSLSKIASNDETNIKDRTNIFSERQSSLEKFAKTLYNTSPAFNSKYRKPRQKLRSKTVDPRFQRSRSPYRPLNASQSTIDLNDLSMPHREHRKKSQSSSRLHYAEQNESARYDKISLEGKAESTPTHTLLPETKQPSISTENGDYCNVYKDTTSLETKADLSSDALKHETMVNVNSVTELDSLEYDRNNETNSNCPYWDDPRLLEKHKVIRQAKNSNRVNSCITVPILSKQPLHGIICRNCLTSQQRSNYNYDDGSDVYNCSIITNDMNDFGMDLDMKDKHMINAIFVVMGSLMGLITVSLLGWIVCTNFNWVIPGLRFWEAAPPPPENSFVFYCKYISQNILDGINFAFENLYKLITLPRSKVLHLNEAEAEDRSPWWLNIL